MNWPRLLAGALLAGTAWGAPSFPKTNPEPAFPELKVYDSAGHPWRAAREDWEGARRRTQQDAGWTAWRKHEQRSIEDWMRRHEDHVEWACGWWHDFVSPKDGSHLDWTDEVPGRDVAFLHSASDPRVEITPKLFAAWVFTFRGNHASMMRRAALLYRLTGDERFAAWAAAQLDFYADHYPAWAPNRDGARLYWQTLDVATNLIQYANTVRALGDYAPPARRARWYEKFFLPQVEVLNRTQQAIHNIATWHRCAVMQVGLVFDRPELWRNALDGTYGLRQQMAQGITSDYLWWEQSFGYNSYVVRAVVTLFTQAGLYGRAAELAPEMATAENLMLAPIYLRFPDGRAPNPADNAGAPLRVPDPGLLGSVYRVFPTTIGLREAARDRNWDTLLDPPPPAAGSTALPPVTSRRLESSRMALLRAQGWQVFFHYGQLTRSHAQAEALNFAAFCGETDVTHDPGTVGYGSPLHREYYTRGLNHNVPLVDGEGEQAPQPGELVAYSESPPRVSARQPHYRPNAAASRTLEIVDGTLVDTTSIETTGGPHRLGLALHLQGHLTTVDGFIADPTFAADRPPAFRHWRDVKRASYDRRAELPVKLGAQFLRVIIEAPAPFTVWHGSAPDIPPRRRDGFYVELDAPATTTTFQVRFTPTK